MGCFGIGRERGQCESEQTAGERPQGAQARIRSWKLWSHNKTFVVSLHFPALPTGLLLLWPPCYGTKDTAVKPDNHKFSPSCSGESVPCTEAVSDFQGVAQWTLGQGHWQLTSSEDWMSFSFQATACSIPPPPLPATPGRFSKHALHLTKK